MIGRVSAARVALEEAIRLAEAKQTLPYADRARALLESLPVGGGAGREPSARLTGPPIANDLLPTASDVAILVVAEADPHLVSYQQAPRTCSARSRPDLRQSTTPPRSRSESPMMWILAASAVPPAGNVIGLPLGLSRSGTSCGGRRRRSRRSSRWRPAIPSRESCQPHAVDVDVTHTGLELRVGDCSYDPPRRSGWMTSGVLRRFVGRHGEGRDHQSGAAGLHGRGELNRLAIEATEAEGRGCIRRSAPGTAGAPAARETRASSCPAASRGRR